MGRTIVTRRESTNTELRQQLTNASRARRYRNKMTSRTRKVDVTPGWLQLYKAIILPKLTRREKDTCACIIYKGGANLHEML